MGDPASFPYYIDLEDEGNLQLVIRSVGTTSAKGLLVVPHGRDPTQKSNQTFRQSVIRRFDENGQNMTWCLSWRALIFRPFWSAPGWFPTKYYPWRKMVASVLAGERECRSR